MTSPRGVADSTATDHPSAPPADRCPNCHRPLDARFCPDCGERRASDRHYSLAHFGEEIAETFTHADGTLWRTFKALVLRPGELTAAYMRGERMRFMKPLSLFLVISVVYFVVSSAAGARTFDTPLRVHMRRSNHGVIATRMVNERLTKRKISLDSYETPFNKASTAHAKSLVIVMVPVFALVVMLLEIRRHRFALQHLIFSLHAYTFLLVLSIVVDGVLVIPIWLIRSGRWILGGQQLDNAVGFVVLLTMGVYYALALGRAYGDGRVAATLKSVALVVSMALILFLYRAFLFFVTYWTT